MKILPFNLRLFEGNSTQSIDAHTLPGGSWGTMAQAPLIPVEICFPVPCLVASFCSRVQEGVVALGDFWGGRLPLTCSPLRTCAPEQQNVSLLQRFICFSNQVLLQMSNTGRNGVASDTSFFHCTNFDTSNTPAIHAFFPTREKFNS